MTKKINKAPSSNPIEVIDGKLNTRFISVNPNQDLSNHKVLVMTAAEAELLTGLLIDYEAMLREQQAKNKPKIKI